MAKRLEFKNEAKAKMQKGVTLLSNVVKATMGPCGRSVLIVRKNRALHTTKDGATVAEAVKLEESFANMGASIVKEAAFKMRQKRGDGTTTAIVLASSLFQEGLKHVVGGADPMQIKRGLDEGLKIVLAFLDKMAKPVASALDVATLAANHDKEIGEIVTKALNTVGREGSVTVERGDSQETKVKISEGVVFKGGYLSPYFVNNPEKMQCEIEDCYVFVTDKKLTSAYDVVPILQGFLEGDKNKALFLIAAEIEGEALKTLVINCLKGGLQLLAVKAPYFGEERRSLLLDIAALTGATFIAEERGLTPQALAITHFGRAKKVKSDKEETTLIGGSLSKDLLAHRVKEIKAALCLAKSSYEREKLQKRLSLLSGGIAVIQVGALTEGEVKEKKERAEDALAAAKAALEEGILPGGGVALLRAAAHLEKVSLTEEPQKGIDILKKTLTHPFRVILENAGYSPETLLASALAGKEDFGFNALTGNFENLLASGIVDPALVTKEALLAAVSTAGMLLTVEVMIAESPKKKKAAFPPLDSMDHFS